MKGIYNLEFRKYEESAYDFVDASGKRQSGISKSYYFLNEDEVLMKVSLPKDVTVNVEMKKGQTYQVVLDSVNKTIVDKYGNVSQKYFNTSYSLLEVVANPFEQKKQEDKK